jgi:uncharacterized protein (TIGR02246 family)
MRLSFYPNPEAYMILHSSLRSWIFLGLLLAIGPSAAGGQGIKRPTIPLRKAIDELRDLRQNYAEAFNKKDTVTVAGMYSPEAILIRENGSVLVGRDAIRKVIATESPQWPEISIEPDSTRVVGHTAWETGTTHMRESGGGERVSHYLIVLRRGLKYWKINSLALVPESADSAAAMRARPAGQ